MSWVSYEKFKTVCEAINTKMGKYLPLSGGTMTGALNVIEPTEDTHATTKKYVDDAIAGSGGGDYVAKTGDTMTGDLVVDNAKIDVKGVYSDQSYQTTDPNNVEIYNGYVRATYVGENGYPPTSPVGMFARVEYVDTRKRAIVVQNTLNSVGLTFIKNVADVQSSYQLTLAEETEAKYARLECTNQNRSAFLGSQIDFNYIGGVPSSLSINLQSSKSRLAVGNMYPADSSYFNYGRLAVADPTDTQDATNKKYVDTAIATKVNTADEMTQTELNTLLNLFA